MLFGGIDGLKAAVFCLNCRGLYGKIVIVLRYAVIFEYLFRNGTKGYHYGQTKRVYHVRNKGF